MNMPRLASVAATARSIARNGSRILKPSMHATRNSFIAKAGTSVMVSTSRRVTGLSASTATPFDFITVASVGPPPLRSIWSNMKSRNGCSAPRNATIGSFAVPCARLPMPPFHAASSVGPIAAKVSAAARPVRIRLPGTLPIPSPCRRMLSVTKMRGNAVHSASAAGSSANVMAVAASSAPPSTPVGNCVTLTASMLMRPASERQAPRAGAPRHRTPQGAGIPDRSRPPTPRDRRRAPATAHGRAP